MAEKENKLIAINHSDALLKTGVYNWSPHVDKLELTSMGHELFNGWNTWGDYLGVVYGAKTASQIQHHEDPHVYIRFMKMFSGLDDIQLKICLARKPSGLLVWSILNRLPITNTEFMRFSMEEELVSPVVLVISTAYKTKTWAIGACDVEGCCNSNGNNPNENNS